MAVRVVIVDRFRSVAEALEASLARTGLMEIAGVYTAADDTALEGLRSLGPDVVLLEAKTGGPPFVRRVRRAVPATTVIALTSFADPVERTAILAAGARAYVVQDRSPENIVKAILGEGVSPAAGSESKGQA